MPAISSAATDAAEYQRQLALIQKHCHTGKIVILGGVCAANRVYQAMTRPNRRAHYLMRMSCRENRHGCEHEIEVVFCQTPIGLIGQLSDVIAVRLWSVQCRLGATRRFLCKL